MIKSNRPALWVMILSLSTFAAALAFRCTVRRDEGADARERKPAQVRPKTVGSEQGNTVVQRNSLDRSTKVRSLSPVSTAEEGIVRAPEHQGKPYLPEQWNRSVLKKKDDAYQVWLLDERELEWLLSNERRVFTADLDTCPGGWGGLRITRIRSDSFAARRGLQVGDLLVDINGRPFDRSEDLDSWILDPGASAATGLRVTLEREGESIVVDYLQNPAP